jgi:hypothetical protein
MVMRCNLAELNSGKAKLLDNFGACAALGVVVDKRHNRFKFHRGDSTFLRRYPPYETRSRDRRGESLRLRD